MKGVRILAVALVAGVAALYVDRQVTKCEATQWELPNGWVFGRATCRRTSSTVRVDLGKPLRDQGHRDDSDACTVRQSEGALMRWS